MTAPVSKRFARGFLEGLIVASLLVSIATGIGHGFPPGGGWSGPLEQLLDWTRRNLGASLVVFTVVLCLYLHCLSRLRQLLAIRAPVQDIAQAEQLLDLWTNVFFGVGVVWTAVGMRAALVGALGDPDEAARNGAFALLTRLVDGGILTALSTTIVGGVGGYLMRVVKTVLVGPELKRLYIDLGDQHSADVKDRLRSLDAKAQMLVQFVHRRERQLDAASPLDRR